MKRSFVSIPKTVKAGEPFIVELKGVGWTQIDNTVAVTYDNSYIGYACGFNSNGYVRIQLTATGEPGTHLIDLYPLLYTQQPAYPYSQLGMVPLLGFANDAPGLAARLRPARVPPGDHGRRVGESRSRGRRSMCRLPPRPTFAVRGATATRARRRATHARQPPVGASEQRDQRGHEEHPHDRRVEQDPSASPRPNCCRPGTRPTTKPEKTATMMSAAAVTIRPVRTSPYVTARRVSCAASHSSRIGETRNTS